MRRILLMTALLLATACSRQNDPAPTAESQSDNAVASAPNGVGSQRDGDAHQPGTAQKTPNGTAPPSATAQDQTRNTGQSATSRSSADQQGLTASPPD
jgi:hypothetical protein